MVFIRTCETLKLLKELQQLKVHDHLISSSHGDYWTLGFKTEFIQKQNKNNYKQISNLPKKSCYIELQRTVSNKKNHENLTDCFGI